MLWLFKPVETSLWFDIREFEFNSEFIPSKFKWVKVSDFKWIIDELPVFKPHAICTQEEWVEQFKPYSWFIDRWPVIYLWWVWFRNTEKQQTLF